ncbi:MAG: PilZ domain-containing protein [Comamonadaceae bacterium]|nr:MAG: PilZ domain-containing protein [Comamonadaceae bacterium]
MASNDTLQAAREQRRADRFDTGLPVSIEGASGQTHNVSAQGIYFETDSRQELGSLVNFTVEFTLYGHKHRLLCEGKVVRVEPRGDRVGVAARLVAPFFDEDRTSSET